MKRKKDDGTTATISVNGGPEIPFTTPADRAAAGDVLRDAVRPIIRHLADEHVDETLGLRSRMTRWRRRSRRSNAKSRASAPSSRILREAQLADPLRPVGSAPSVRREGPIVAVSTPHPAYPHSHDAIGNLQAVRETTAGDPEPWPGSRTDTAAPSPHEVERTDGR